MSLLENLSALACRGLAFGACQAVGMETGEKIVEPVTRFLSERFLHQGERLHRALARANERAWQILEFGLAGESLWDRCTSLFTRVDEKTFREQLRAFLDALPPDLFAGGSPEFRRQALEELRLARKEGILQLAALDVRHLARQIGVFAGFASPDAVLAAEHQALAEIADSLPGDRFEHLRHLLLLTLPTGDSLLACAARYFFRREIEDDRELFQGLAFVLLERQTDQIELGFHKFANLLNQHGDRMNQLLINTLEMTTRTHDEIVKLSARIDQFLARQQLDGRELRPDDSLLSITEDERRLVRDLVKRYRELPDEQRAGRVELAFKIGQVEAITGDLDNARRDFQLAARLAVDPLRQAEAHASAFQASLAGNDLDTALSELLEAARLDPERFTPFPLDKYRPSRIVGSGGFGTAFLCRHSFKRDAVVVKTLRTTGLDRSIDEIFNEAQILAGLTHPAIIGVVDCDFADRAGRQRPYVVMEFFDGITLARQVQTHGSISPIEFLPMAKLIAQGLQAAHDRGVFHRDVKPANLLIHRTTGTSIPTWDIKIIDFGLALRPAWLAVTRIGSSLSRSSLFASVAGTFKYAAPEQLGELPGVDISASSDIYSFGRTCYYALLGTPEPDDEEKKQLPENWRRLLSACTSRLPGRRPGSMGEVLKQLERFTVATTSEEESPYGPPLVLSAPPTPAAQQTLGFEPLPPLEPLPALQPLPTLELMKPIEPTPTLVKGKEQPPAPAKPKTPARPARPARVATINRPRTIRATCVHSLSGHEGTVSVVCFRPDGRILATGGFDDRVRLWSFPSGQPLVTLEGHLADVNGLAFRRDGTLLASAGDDRDVRLWSIPGGQAGAVLRHPDRVYAVGFSPDSRILATGCDDYKVRLWSPATTGMVAILSGHTSFVRHLAFSPDGKTLATASGDRTVILWNMPAGQKRTILNGHSHTVWSVAYSPDGRYLATGSQDRTARIWHAGTGELHACCEGHEEIVWSVAFSPDGRMLATASHDRTVRLWNTHDGQLLAVLPGHTELVRYLMFSPDGRYLATAGGDCQVRVWLLHDDSEPCDWSAGQSELPPRPKVTLTRAGNGVVYPGDEVWLDIAVENTGRGDLVQLRASVESDSPYLRGLSALFGRIHPGQRMSRCLGAVLPADLSPMVLRGEVVFQEGNDYHPASMPIIYEVRTLPRDDFHVSWQLVDDGSGNSFGDGDGVPQRGECIDVVVTVENGTGQDLDGMWLNLSAEKVPAGVVINIPRTELPPIGDGTRAEGRVTFSIKPSAKTGPASFELRVETSDGRLFARMPIMTRIE